MIAVELRGAAIDVMATEGLADLKSALSYGGPLHAPSVRLHVRSGPPTSGPVSLTYGPVRPAIGTVA